MSTLSVLARRTSMTEAEIRRFGALVLEPDRLCEASLLPILIFDLLVQSGFKSDNLYALLRWCKQPLLDLNHEYLFAKEGIELKLNMLHIADNRYVTLPELQEGIYDITNSVLVTQIRPPCLSLAVVLPVLYRRATANR